MQLLTGHGIFNSYMMRLNKENSDDAEHALLKCPRWILQRTAIKNFVCESINTGNILKYVTADNNIRKKFQIFYYTITKTRQVKEKEIE
jgi:hypothetical protein